MKYGYNKLVLVHSVENMLIMVNDNAIKSDIAGKFGKVGMTVMVDADNDVHVYIDVRDRGYLAGVASAAGVKMYTDSDVVNSDEFNRGVSDTLRAFALASAMVAEAYRKKMYIVCITSDGHTATCSVDFPKSVYEENVYCILLDGFRAIDALGTIVIPTAKGNINISNNAFSDIVRYIVMTIEYKHDIARLITCDGLRIFKVTMTKE